MLEESKGFLTNKLKLVPQKQWKQIADAAGLDIPAMERIVPALDALEAAFRPLVKKIPYDVEPALVFRAAEDVPGESR